MERRNDETVSNINDSKYCRHSQWWFLGFWTDGYNFLAKALKAISPARCLSQIRRRDSGLGFVLTRKRQFRMLHLQKRYCFLLKFPRI